MRKILRFYVVPYGSISFLLLLHLCLLSYGQVMGADKKVTIIANNTPVRDIFTRITEQTGYEFSYQNSDLNEHEKVTGKFVNQDVEDVLAKIFSGKGLAFKYMGNVIAVYKQPATIPAPGTGEPLVSLTGTVTDQDRNPLPGATVIIKGTKSGTSSDEDGKFSLQSIPADAILLISYTSFEAQEIAIRGKRNLTVSLKRVIGSLDETVVVAYNTTTQRANTGAVTVVRGEQIQNLPNRSFDKSLQGLVPGLLVTSGTGQPGGGVSNFVLRGIATAADPTGGSTVRNPLIIIDGIPVSQDQAQLRSDVGRATLVSNPIAQLNPTDIETITVLKDAAAIALYGSRASNGVIVITTKKGQSGKTRFNFRHQTDISTRLGGKVDVLNQQEFMDLLYETYRNTPRVIGGVSTPWTDADIQNDLKNKFPIRADGSFYPAPDWEAELYNNQATTVANELSVSGGNEKNNFYLNLEYTKQNGIVKETGYDRKSLRFNFENRPNDWLKIGLNTVLSYSIQDYGGSLNSGTYAATISQLSPLNPVRLEDGNYFFNYDYGGLYTQANPAAATAYNISRNTAFRGLNKLYAEIDFLKWFKFTSNLGIDYMQAEAKEKTDPRLFDVTIFSTGGRIEERNIRRANLITTNLLRFDKALNKSHTLGLVLGQEAQVLNQKDLSVGVRGLSLPYYDQITSPGVTVFSQSGFVTKETLLSFFGQANYSIKNKYFLSGSIRTDGSSRFGEDKRFGTYWSAGAGWVLTSEPFMKAAASWISYLKIRGSVGAAGNAGAINRFTRFDKLQATTFFNNTAVYPNQAAGPGNPGVKWERTFTTDAGIEARLLNERIFITADVYRRSTSDLLYNINLPLSSGFSSMLSNIGTMQNSGIELSVAADIIRNKNFRWNVNANWSVNRNILTKADGPVASTVENVLANKAGENFNSFYLVRWAGVNPGNGTPQWIDSTGKISNDYYAAKPGFVGKPQPDGFGSITNAFSYQGIEISAMLYYQYGYQIYNRDQLVNDGQQPFMNQDRRALDRWRKSGDIVANPKRSLNATTGSSLSTRYLFKGDHIRLQNVTISYNFPRRITERLHVGMLKAYLQGQNLALWTIFPGQDPATVNVVGSTEAVYPNQRSFSAGLNVSF